MKQWLVLSALVASTAMADPGTWTRIGPEGGNFSAVAVDPDDPDRAYAISNQQVYIRAAAGEPWRHVNEPYFSYAVAASPGGRVYLASSDGLYRSHDHGVRFERLDAPGDLLSDIAADPDDPDVVYVVSTTGVRRSSDGGASWSSPGGGLPAAATPFAIEIDPNDADTVYVALREHGLFVSDDGAATWSSLNDGLPCPATAGPLELVCITSLAIVPGDPPTLLVGTPHGGLLRSTDGGTTWQSAAGEIDTQIVTALAVAGASGAVYAGVASAHGFGDDDAFFRVLRSSDGGASWRAAGTETLPAAIAALAAPAGDGETVFAATGALVGLGFQEGAGLFRSADGGATWQLDQRDLSGTCPVHIEAAPTAMTTLHALGWYDRWRVYTQRAAASWEADELTSTFLTGLDVDPNDPLRVYAIASDAALAISEDGAASWTISGSRSFLQTYDLAVDARDGATLYVAAAPLFGEGRHIFKSDDAGDSWREVLRLPTALSQASRVVVDSGSNAVYALDDTALLRSRDGGESWEQLVQTSVTVEVLRNLTVAPTTPPTLLRESTSGLRISRDDGRSWHAPRFPGLEPAGVAAVAVDPSRALTLYVLPFDQDGRGKLLRSDDGGNTWRAVAHETRPYATALAVDPHDRQILYAATCGAGVQMVTQVSSAAGGGDTDGCAVGPPRGASALPLLAAGLLALLRRRR